MSVSVDHFTPLLNKYLDDSLTAEEFRVFRSMLADPQYQLLFKQSLDHAFDRQVYQDMSLDVNEDQLYRKMLTAMITTQESLPAHIPLWRSWGWAAAVALLVLCLGAYFWFAQDAQSKTSPTMVVQEQIILPGVDGAILTLADGSQRVLDSIAGGVVALQSGAVAKIIDGKLVYEAGGKEVLYNQLTTPKGRQFQVTLPDGTKVWLNAASSIRYPTVFMGTERLIEISGEVYLEVASNKQMPFKINVRNQAQVLVLGTHLNIKAYDNEQAIYTTLLEGGVKVGTVEQASALTLQPGQQAQMRNSKDAQRPFVMTTIQANVEQVMAWKNGLFNFEGADLQEVMRQLERWYNIEVTYPSSIPDIHFIGEMKKNMPLLDVLDILQQSSVHFRLEDDRRLMVMP